MTSIGTRALPVLALAGVLTAGVADAASIALDNFTGRWLNVVGGSNLDFDFNPGNNPRVNWGVGQEQSGYWLNLAPPPEVPIINVVPPDTAPFDIGTFTHRNQPITGTPVTSVDLRIGVNIRVGTTSIGTRNFDFRFLHNETPNDADPCAFGGRNDQGVNRNGCADRVRIQFLDTSESFFVGAEAYTLNLVGFSVDGVPTSEFLTMERKNNDAVLRAQITSRRPGVAVPEPATLALLGLGLGLAGLAGVRRRRA